jgi:hypothetical protein
VGCQNLDGFESVALGQKVDVNKVMKNVTQLAQSIIKKDPKIKAFVFECTQLSTCSNAVRQATGIPVYDALTTIETFCISKKPNTRIQPTEPSNQGITAALF